MQKLVLLLVLALGSSGCTMFEYVKPHQLYKLNRQKAPKSEHPDAFFSVPAKPMANDPFAATTTAFQSQSHQSFNN